MKNWFTSLNGALVLSTLSLLAFIGYALMEFRYFLEKWIPGVPAAAIETIAVLVISGLWVRALFVAHAGRRGGWITLLVLSVFNILVFVYDMQFLFAGKMPILEQIMLVVLLIAGVVATAALVPQLRRK